MGKTFYDKTFCRLFPFFSSLWPNSFPMIPVLLLLLEGATSAAHHCALGINKSAQAKVVKVKKVLFWKALVLMAKLPFIFVCYIISLFFLFFTFPSSKRKMRVGTRGEEGRKTHSQIKCHGLYELWMDSGGQRVPSHLRAKSSSEDNNRAQGLDEKECFSIFHIAVFIVRTKTPSHAFSTPQTSHIHNSSGQKKKKNRERLLTRIK